MPHNGTGGGARGRISGSHIVELNEWARTVEHAASFTQNNAVLMIEGGTPRDVVVSRVSGGFFDVFGVSMAAALAAIGIFGVIADATAQRTREFATRLALGATPGNVVAVLLRQARALSAFGLVVGVAAAYAGGRIAASRLFQVSAGDPVVLAVAPAPCWRSRW